MHIPENYLSPTTCAAMGAVMLPIWYKAVKEVKVKVDTDKKTIPMLGIGTSLSFLIMMFNLPAPGGTSAHAVGAVLIAILLGPWASCLAVSVALAMQALLFGDGGILAFGANAFCMAVVMPFVGYAVYKLLNKWTKNRIIASFFGGYIGIVAAALTVAVLLGIQPILFKDSSGNPLYNPYVWHRKDGTLVVSPAKGRPYANRQRSFKYKITTDDLCYRLFRQHGFVWGGAWKHRKDFQHFEKRVQ